MQKTEGEEINDPVESMVMANGSGDKRSRSGDSHNQSTDRTCISDVERILHNESYRKPFQVKFLFWKFQNFSI